MFFTSRAYLDDPSLTQSLMCPYSDEEAELLQKATVTKMSRNGMMARIYAFPRSHMDRQQA